MGNIRIAGVLKSAKKVHYFKSDLIQLKIEVEYKKGRYLSSIVYAPIEKTSLLTLPTGAYISIRGTTKVAPQNIKRKYTKEFIIFYLEDYIVTKDRRNCNSIEVAGIVTTVHESSVVNNIKHCSIDLLTELDTDKSKCIFVSYQSSVEGADLVKEGAKLSLNGFVKTRRHSIGTCTGEIEFDTFNISANKFTAK